MAVITVIVDAPDYGSEAFESGIVHLGHEFTRLVKMQLAIDDNVSLREITVEGDQTNVGVKAPKPPKEKKHRHTPAAEDDSYTLKPPPPPRSGKSKA